MPPVPATARDGAAGAADRRHAGVVRRRVRRSRPRCAAPRGRRLRRRQGDHQVQRRRRQCHEQTRGLKAERVGREDGEHLARGPQPQEGCRQMRAEHPQLHKDIDGEPEDQPERRAGQAEQLHPDNRGDDGHHHAYLSRCRSSGAGGRPRRRHSPGSTTPLAAREGASGWQVRRRPRRSPGRTTALRRSGAAACGGDQRHADGRIAHGVDQRAVESGAITVAVALDKCRQQDLVESGSSARRTCDPASTHGCRRPPSRRCR